MTLEGAMSEDLESLDKQIAAILPDDEHGRPVWFVDRIRAVPQEVSRQSLVSSKKQP
jgi:hypothetical protein